MKEDSVLGGNVVCGWKIGVLDMVVVIEIRRRGGESS